MNNPPRERRASSAANRAAPNSIIDASMILHFYQAMTKYRYDIAMISPDSVLSLFFYSFFTQCGKLFDDFSWSERRSSLHQRMIAAQESSVGR
jgi:hypothetical protein